MKRIGVKSVRLLAGPLAKEAVAAVSTTSPVSSMSERLADKLAVYKLCPTKVENLGFLAGAFLPDRAIHVSCSVSRRQEVGMVPRPTIGEERFTVPVAFLIMPSLFYEVVLGRDWLVAASGKIGGPVVISKTDEAPRNQNYVHVGEGMPTHGPGFVEGANPLSHLLTVNQKDYAKLMELAEAAKEVFPSE